MSAPRVNSPTPPVTCTRVDTLPDTAWITLEHRSVDLACAESLATHLATVADDPAIRCVVLTGRGRIFSVGGDLGALADPATPVRAVVTTLNRAVLSIATMPKPVLAAVNGTAAGGGMGLALGTDLVVATESARFVPAFSAIGAPPDTGFTAAVSRLSGPATAYRLYTENPHLSATEAADLGLVSHVHPDRDFRDAVERHVHTLLGIPTAAAAATKRLLRESPDVLAARLEAEADAMCEIAATDDFRDRVRAFHRGHGTPRSVSP